MTAINQVPYGPIITMNGGIGVKVTEDGRASLKVIMDQDQLFLSKDEKGDLEQGITFNFVDDGTEMPIDQKGETKRERTGLSKHHISIDNEQGRKTDIETNWSWLSKHSYQSKTGDTVVNQQRTQPGRDDMKFTTPNGTVSLTHYPYYKISEGYVLNTPAGDYKYVRTNGHPDYDLTLPGDQGTISLVKQMSITPHYKVEMPYGQSFDLKSDLAGNWKVVTPSNRVVEIKRQGLTGNFKIITEFGTSEVKNQNFTKYNWTVKPVAPTK